MPAPSPFRKRGWRCARQWATTRDLFGRSARWGTSRARGLPARASALFAEDLALCDATGCRDGRADALHGLGCAALARGATARARECFAEGLDLCRRIGEKLGRAGALWGLGEAASVEGDCAGAAALLKESLALH